MRFRSRRCWSSAAGCRRKDKHRGAAKAFIRMNAKFFRTEIVSVEDEVFLNEIFKNQIRQKVGSPCSIIEAGASYKELRQQGVMPTIVTLGDLVKAATDIKLGQALPNSSAIEQRPFQLFKGPARITVVRTGETFDCLEINPTMEIHAPGIDKWFAIQASVEDLARLRDEPLWVPWTD